MAFILFTEAVNQFPFSNLWAVLFFLMLLSLGLDSQFGTLQGVVQCFVDLKLFPNLRKEIMTGKSTSITILVLHNNSRFPISMYIIPINDDM